MNGRSESSTAVATLGRTKKTVAAASGVLLVIALAGCVASPEPSEPTPTSTSSAEADPTPLPAIDPLIIPGCDDLLPLSSAQALFSEHTQKLADEDTVASGHYDLPELITVAANASIAKNCAWGVPNSDGVFSLTIADISDTDAAKLTASLVSFGYLGVTSAGVTSLEFSTETEIGTIARTHYVVGDVWIFVEGPSLSLTTDVANLALDEVRLANPTRSY